MSRVRFKSADPAVYFERPAPLSKLIELMAPLIGDPAARSSSEAEEWLTPCFSPKSLDAEREFHFLGGSSCLGACIYTRTAPSPQCDVAELSIERVVFDVFDGGDDEALADLISTVVAEFSGEIGLGSGAKPRPEEERELPGRLRRVDGGEDRCDPVFFSAWRKRPSFKLFS